MGWADFAAEGVKRRAHQGVVLRDDEILQHGHRRKEPDILKRAHDTGARDVHVAQLVEADGRVGL